jgi:hypothetical protein
MSQEKTPLTGPVFELTVVVANNATRRQAAETWLARTPHGSRAILAEGAALALPAPEDVASVALGAGCPCCVGFVTLRVALTRLLRDHRPAHTLLLIADPRHLEGFARRLAATSFGVDLRVRFPGAEISAGRSAGAEVVS